MANRICPRSYVRKSWCWTPTPWLYLPLTREIWVSFLEERHVLQLMKRALLDNHVPLKVFGMGTVYTVPWAMYVMEEYHMLLRLFTALEILCHDKLYDPERWLVIDILTSHLTMTLLRLCCSQGNIGTLYTCLLLVQWSRCQLSANTPLPLFQWALNSMDTSCCGSRH